MASLVYKMNDGEVYNVPIREENIKVEYDAINTVIENCLEKGSGKITGNLGIGTTTFEGKTYKNSDIKSIEIVF